MDHNHMRPDSLAISVGDAADLIGISRSKAYAMAAAGDLPTVHIGKTLVPMEALRQWLVDRERQSKADLANTRNAEERPSVGEGGPR
jgi:excisionase family DNA binding protein